MINASSSCIVMEYSFLEFKQAVLAEWLAILRDMVTAE